ncbi:MAG: hypothetical protein NZ853_00705 [Leptospiraceae bacterium]|nr:hypothetical protein [Leptospiraceae bacterium]MDW7976252.1 hypothetical protein [Leptospiraceae bacterium]
MEKYKQLIKIFGLFFAIFAFSILVFRKKIESIILDRELYLLQLEHKELLRENKILKTELAKRKSQESLLYYWEVYRTIPNHENQKTIKIVIETDKKQE